MKRLLLSAALLTALATLGMAGALIATPTARADVNADVNGLGALGYTLGLRSYPSADLVSKVCYMTIVLRGNGAPETDGDEIVIGDLNPDHADYCASSAAEIRARIAKLIADYPPAPPVTTTTTDTPPATVDAPPTTTPDAPAAGPTVDEQLAAINAKLDALTTKVDALAKANTAAWDAFVAALDSGASAADAALAARSAGLNAVYGL